MPIGPGYYDVNGIRRTGEDDIIGTTFSDFLDDIEGSVSTTIGAMLSRLNALETANSNWQSYTPTTLTGFTPGTGGTSAFRFRQLGGDIEVEFSLVVGGTGAAVGAVQFSLPGVIIFAANYRAFQRVGEGQANNNDVAGVSAPLIVLRSGSSNTLVSVYAVNSAGTFDVVAATGPSAPVAFVTGGSLVGRVRFRKFGS